MIVLAVVFAIIVLLALTRFGVKAVYGSDGIILIAHAGFVKIRVYPMKPRKPRKPREKKIKAKPRVDASEKPGSFETFKELQPAIFKTLGRLRRRLLIKELRIYYLAAGENPAATALSFGGANALFSVISAQLENCFRIKTRDFRANADFSGGKASIYFCAIISMAVWEAVYVSLTILPALLTLRSNKNSVKTKGKEAKNNG